MGHDEGLPVRYSAGFIAELTVGKDKVRLLRGSSTASRTGRCGNAEATASNMLNTTDGVDAPLATLFLFGNRLARVILTHSPEFAWAFQQATLS